MAETSKQDRFAFRTHWRSIVFNALAATFFVVTFYLVLRDPSWASAGRGSVTFLSAAFCGIIGNIEHFESFTISLTGVGAKLREVQQVLDDAQATVASLHELATMTGAFLVDNIAGSGRWGGQGIIQQKDAAKEKLLKRLKAIGLSDDALGEVSRGDRHWVCIDYVHGIFSRPPAKLPPEDSSALNELIQRTVTEPASPEECESMLKRLKVTEPFVTALLEDYRHYVRTGEHRRPDVWRDRMSWRFRHKEQG